MILGVPFMIRTGVGASYAVAVGIRTLVSGRRNGDVKDLGSRRRNLSR